MFAALIVKTPTAGEISGKIFWEKIKCSEEFSALVRTVHPFSGSGAMPYTTTEFLRLRRRSPMPFFFLLSLHGWEISWEWKSDDELFILVMWNKDEPFLKCWAKSWMDTYWVPRSRHVNISMFFCSSLSMPMPKYQVGNFSQFSRNELGWTKLIVY